MRFSRELAFALAALVSLAAGHGRPQVPPQVKLPTEGQVMAVKLKHAEGLVRAVALHDFKTIDRLSTELNKISQAAEFMNAHRIDEYQFQARVFQRAAGRMAEKAKEKNMDGVLLAYLELNASCVRCHQTFRGGRVD